MTALFIAYLVFAIFTFITNFIRTVRTITLPPSIFGKISLFIGLTCVLLFWSAIWPINYIFYVLDVTHPVKGMALKLADLIDNLEDNTPDKV